MRKVNWGVLGTANIAATQTIPAMLQANNCNLYGTAGRSIEKVDEFKEKFGFQKAFYSLEAMLQDPEVEAVYIPLPHTLHKEWVIKAAKSGKHILCEKPLSGNADDIAEMIKVCDEHGVIFMEAFAYLHNPAIKEIKALLDSGAIGEFSMMETVFFTGGCAVDDFRMYRDSLGGALYDLGCYNTSLILTMVGEEPQEVKAFSHFTENKVDDFTSGYFGFKNGKKACFQTAMCCAQRGDRFFIYGTKGTIEAPIQFNEPGRLTYFTIIDQVKKEYTVEAPNNYMLEVEQLGRCIIEGEKPHISHEFSMANARTIDKLLVEMGY
jgi:predicted dehydrogenase